AELPKHQDDLPAVVSRMIQGVLDELSQNVGVFINGARRTELLLRQLAGEGGFLFLEALPARHDRRKLRKVRWRPFGTERYLSPEPEPATLSPEEMPQGPFDRGEAPAKVPVELFIRQLARRLQQPLIGPAAVGKPRPNLL